MFITYNDVNLSLTSIDRVQRDTILSDDGTTVLYVENTISVSCVYAPGIGVIPQIGGTSIGGYNQTNRGLRPGQNASGQTFVGQNQKAYPIVTSGSNPLTPTACTTQSPGSSGWSGPLTTDRELELRLRVPRKKLIVWAFDIDGNPKSWIESPINDNICDAKCGPLILGCHVKESPNANSFFVALDIRTWIPPTSVDANRPVLSHRWQMTHEEDEAHYLTRTITGEVVFNVGMLHTFENAADWFRSEMFHPIPIGFERRLGPITLSPDGTTLRYQYSDTDPKIIFDPGDTGATQISIVENAAYLTPARIINTA